MLCNKSIIEGITAQPLYFGVFNIPGFSIFEYLGPGSCIKEFTFRVQQFKCIPLAGIMACSQNDAPLGLVRGNSYFNGGCGRQTQVNHINPHSHQGSGNQVANHKSRNTGVAANNHFHFPPRVLVQDVRGKAGNKFYNIRWGKVITRFPANGTPDS